jgi:hypothetical protein
LKVATTKVYVRTLLLSIYSALAQAMLNWIVHACSPVPSQSKNEMDVWPADLPTRARWLPYNAEPIHHSPPSLQPPRPAPTRRPGSFWPVRIFVVLGAGLIGIGGGMAAASFFGR